MKVIKLIIVVNLLGSAQLLAQSDAFLLDTNCIYRPTFNGQEHPAVVSDGTNYFVVWYDWRNAVSYHSDMATYGNIYGCRITPEGVIVDSAGILISSYVYIVGYAPCTPGIAYGDGVYLVTWTDYRDFLMHAARIDTNGVVLDPDGFVIVEYPTFQYSPSITFDGTNFFVAWWDQRTPFGMIYGCRITPGGEILDPEGILIRDSGVDPYVAVSFSLTNYLVVWSSYSSNDIYGARVDTAGSVLDTLAIPICTVPGIQTDPSLTFGGENYFIAWKDGRVSNTNIYGTRVDTAGIVLDTNGFAISTLPEYEYPPSVAYDGLNYFVTWSDLATIYCTRVDTSGIVLDTVAIIVSQITPYEDPSPSVAFDGANYFIAWDNSTWLWDGEVYGARVETSGVVIDTTPVLLSMFAYQEHSSSASFDSTNYFAVWTDYRDTASTYIYGTRIDTLGKVMDCDGIKLHKGKNPVVAFDGFHYLVACSDRDIKGTCVNKLGMVLDTSTIYSIAPDGCDNPAILFDGSNYFVAFAAWPMGSDIYGVRIDTSGTLLDTNAIIIAHEDTYEDYPAVSFDGVNYFVVWQYGSDLTTYDIYGARISSSGVLIDSPSIHIATGLPWQCYPSVSFDGTNYFVVWQDNRNGYADIYGARVNTNGVVLNPGGIPICTAPSAQYKPEIKFDGHNYCVMWEDWRNGDYTDIYGCYVTPSGAVTQEFIVTAQPNLQLQPTFVKGPDKFLVIYTGFVDSLSGRSANTMRIWAKFQEFVGIEETSSHTPNDGFQLLQNYPNPFTQATEIRFHLPKAVTENQKKNISLRIYDITGRLIKQFQIPVPVKFRSISITWDGRDDSGNHLGAGIYFYKLEMENFTAVKKMILLK